jgi:molybdopterin adenylyltransferase
VSRPLIRWALEDQVPPRSARANRAPRVSSADATEQINQLLSANVRRAAKILTVSDSVSEGRAEDRAGPALAAALEGAGYDVVERALCSDGVESVAASLQSLCRQFVGLVLTTGGTGFAERDLTPEGTLQVVDRLAPGLAEAMRLSDPLGRLSRGVAGCLGRCLVLNTPGSPSGAVEFLNSVLDVLPHALDLLSGHSSHHHHGVADSTA